MRDILKELPQYHFDRQEFIDAFKEVFSDDEIFNIEDMCQRNTMLNNFHLFYTTYEEFYILHLPSGTMLNWYKHLGRTNTCNKEDFDLTDLNEFLQELKSEIPQED